MDFQKLIRQEVQDFIQEHLKYDVSQLSLKSTPFNDLSTPKILQQIKGRQIAEKKFPFLLKDQIIFPPKLNLEQSSSEETALYKASLVKSGARFLDLTTGFGIDAYFISKHFKETTLVEQNITLLEIVKHNWNVLGRSHFTGMNTDLNRFLGENPTTFDLIYLDPARRDHQNKKKFLLEDLSPNLLEIETQLWERTQRIMLKLSPLIDIQYLLSSLQHITQVHVVSVKNEAKEILIILDKNNTQPSECFCVNLNTTDPLFHFVYHSKADARTEFSEPLSYVYLPNHSILKSGAFNLVSERFGVKKLHPNTHLYTSDRKIEEFPGRVFRVEQIHSKDLKKNDAYHIISRNHPLGPNEIKKRYKIKEGGDQYLIFTQSLSKKYILRSL